MSLSIWDLSSCNALRDITVRAHTSGIMGIIRYVIERMKNRNRMHGQFFHGLFTLRDLKEGVSRSINVKSSNKKPNERNCTSYACGYVY